ncbi:serine hydrolase domain-containing protein [Phycicoccus sonneratiae]|uniref:Beta-lactamase family protein n=1 Tax=Phycicoccus sonneratiae TaxID=2807628 RepID=A0ABS2CH32_9MICO|nr:serine hydrolase domain-containing protein [Phycicoccus sonneraticus]MBM6399085.1 beta-lactamase family protein [Phycicoccus sonneraticus]
MTIADRTRTLLDHALAGAQREGRVPSVAAGLVRGGELVWSGAVGTLDGRAGGPAADDDTQYRMGSITKTFVGVCVLRLRDAGRLDLADRFDAHVPGSSLGAVTVEQLLSHSGGVQAETHGPWWERTPGDGWDALAGAGVATPAGQRFRAGRRFHYSNVGFAALGRLLEVAHGTGWADVVRTELLEPLGMTRTTTRPSGRAAPGLAVHPFADVLLPEPEHDGGAMAPAGQLWTTVRDLSRWAAFLGGDTAGLLSTETLEEMCEPHHVVDEVGQPWTGAHGLGWQVWNVDGVRYAGHGGSMPGFLAGLRVRLDGGDGVVTLANTTSTTVMRGLADRLLGVLHDEEPAPVEPWVASGTADLLELVGTWHWGPSVTTARSVGEHLVLGEPGTARGSRFARVGEDEWVGLDGYNTGEPLRVVRRADGTVSHLDLASFRFTRTPYDPAADVPGGVDDLGWT